MRLRYLLFAAAIFLISNFSLFAHKLDHDGTRDTIPAVVIYNSDDYFFPQENFSAGDYSRMIDSLVVLDTIPVHLVNQLNIYRILAQKDAHELQFVIDSLLDAPRVPQMVLGAVNLYMAAMEKALAQPTGFYAFVPECSSPFPANAFYNHWNTEVPNPIRNNLSEMDTTVTLLLVDTLQNCGFYPPKKGVITSDFGWRFGRNHNGIDIDLNVWDPVHAAFPGVVRVAKYYGGYGRVVVVRHYNGLETTYAHLHRFKVKPGDIVEAGDIIGLGGSSGNSTGSHLHFEIRFQGVPIAPSSVIDFINHELKADVIELKRSGAFLEVVKDKEKDDKIFYEVKQGDYLWKIAEEYNTTVDRICKLNKIHSRTRLKTGQKLIVGI